MGSSLAIATAALNDLLADLPEDVRVDMLAYNDDVYGCEIDDLRLLTPDGYTDFVKAFRGVETLAASDGLGSHDPGADTGTSNDAPLCILFLTDGRDTRNKPDAVGAALDRLSAALRSRDGPSKVCALGLTAEHDARLMTRLARAGSDDGFFAYARTATDAGRALVELAEEMPGYGTDAGAGRGGERLPEVGIRIGDAEPVRAISVSRDADRSERARSWAYAFFELLPAIAARETRPNIEKEKRPHGDGKGDDDARIQPATNAAGARVSLLLRPAAVARNERTAASADAGAFSERGASWCDDPDPAIRCSARRDAALHGLLTCSQRLATAKPGSPTPSDLLPEIGRLDAMLDGAAADARRVSDRHARKQLARSCLQAKAAVAQCASLLWAAAARGLDDDSIARVSALAYGFSTRGRRKRMDRRRAANAGDEERRAERIRSALAAVDPSALAAVPTPAGLGPCAVSCASWSEALLDGDALCVALDVARPGESVADCPSRLIVRAVHPTYLTAESFLSAVEFAVGRDPAAHGGFDPRTPALVLPGVARESVTGALPLFVCPEHWAVAREWARPLLGWLATLDPFGYADEQLRTIPFLALAAAVEKEAARGERREFDVAQTELLLRTCLQVYDEQGLRWPTVSSLTRYADDPSARTADAVPSNEVLLARALCALARGHLAPADTGSGLPASPAESESEAEPEARAADAEGTGSAVTVPWERVLALLVEEQIRRFSPRDEDARRPERVAAVLGMDPASWTVCGRPRCDLDAASREREAAFEARFLSRRGPRRSAADEPRAERPATPEAGDGGETEPHDASPSLSSKDPDPVAAAELLPPSAEAADLLRAADRCFRERCSRLWAFRARLGLPHGIGAASLQDVPALGSRTAALAVAVQGLMHSENRIRREAIAGGRYADPTADPRAVLREAARSTLAALRERALAEADRERVRGQAGSFLAARTAEAAAGILLGHGRNEDLGEFWRPLQNRAFAGTCPLAMHKLAMLLHGEWDGVTLLSSARCKGSPLAWDPCPKNVRGWARALVRGPDDLRAWNGLRLPSCNGA